MVLCGGYIITNINGKIYSKKDNIVQLETDQGDLILKIKWNKNVIVLDEKMQDGILLLHGFTHHV